MDFSSFEKNKFGMTDNNSPTTYMWFSQRRYEKEAWHYEAIATDGETIRGNHLSKSKDECAISKEYPDTILVYKQLVKKLLFKERWVPNYPGAKNGSVQRRYFQDDEDIWADGGFGDGNDYSE